MILQKHTKIAVTLFAILVIGSLFSFGAQNRYRMHIRLGDVEKRGVYDIMKLYNDEMCVKEVPFLIALHRCFYHDQRLTKGFKLVLRQSTIYPLKRKAIELYGMKELEESLIYKLDSIILYKLRKNRHKKNLCNFIAYIDSGAYEIPETGAKLIIPNVIKGSIYYNKKNRTSKMTVYLHTGGIKLELPAYAKRITLGILSDMDIGIAELEFIKGNWITRLLYLKSKENPKRKGWSFNMTKCNKIRPYSK